MMPDDDAATDPKDADGATGSGWCDADLDRAIAAAEKAGLPAYRVEIAPNGTIAIIVGG
jgi:hypothetical protein